MTEEQAPPGVDTSRASIARVYDYMLGGKDNFAVDREMFKTILEYIPDGHELAHSNRAWLRRVVRWLARDVGIDQFLDVGSGLPTVENTHEIAQRVDPDSVVVYVDNDPVVIAHGRVLLEADGQAFFAAGDLTTPDELLADPTVSNHLEFDRPIATLQCATLHFVPDQAVAEQIVRSYVDRMASGSYVGITHWAIPDPTDEKYQSFMEFVEKYHTISADFTPRTPADIEALFDGLELVDPGVVPIDKWWPEGPSESRWGFADHLVGGVARKP